MPRAPRFLASVVASLHHDLRFAPAATKFRQMEAAEALIPQLNHDLLYPMEFVVFRVTGYRPETDDRDAKVVGHALKQDLAVFVQAISAEIDVPSGTDRGEAIPLDEVAERLGVSRRTLQRRRGDGLVLHWVRSSDGTRFLGCFPDALTRFREAYPGRHGRPWRRTTSEEREGIMQRARSLAMTDGATFDSVASQISIESGRSRSTIRSILRRGDRFAQSPIFTISGPLTARDVAICRRARSVGIPLRRCARRYGKSIPGLHRALLRDRVRQLEQLPLFWSSFTTFTREDAAEVLLGPDAMQRGLPGPVVRIDPDSMAKPDVDSREHRLVASHWLLARAATRLQALTAQPTVSALDDLETDLRWSGRLRAAVALGGLASTLQACEHWLERPVSALPPSSARSMLEECLRACWTVVGSLEPRFADRLEARCLAFMDRRLSPRTPPPRSRAAVVSSSERRSLVWPLDRWVPWSWLEPAGIWTERFEGMSEEDRWWVTRRWGLAGHRPWSILELTNHAGTTAPAVQRRLLRLEVHMRLNRVG